MSVDPYSRVVSVEEEIASTFMDRPHVVLLGAGASKAALPSGDANGLPVPLLQSLVEDLGLAHRFPDDLKNLAESEFESAYSILHGRDASLTLPIDHDVRTYFEQLALPASPNLYDLLTLSLRPKDAICTFNWDPFLMQSRIRLAKLGVTEFPRLHFLHGNVSAGFCKLDRAMGLVDRNCRSCGQQFEPSPLLFPVENKDYQDDGFIEGEWSQVKILLSNCFMMTIFGYSAPVSDVEAINLLSQGWGHPYKRNLEQTELINRPGLNQDSLRESWSKFILDHHYEIHDSFYDSWIARHPRRTGEAFVHQYLDAKFVSDNSIPKEPDSLEQLIAWFDKLRTAENE